MPSALPPQAWSRAPGHNIKVQASMSEQPTLRLIGGAASGPLVSSAVLGMLIFVVAELMMFSGLISAFAIVEAAAPGGWPPPNQPRLPIEETAFNTLALLLSGVALFVADRRFRRLRRSAARPLAAAMFLGAFFVVFQGVEWWSLLSEGLTLTSSTHGSFFYLIVGMHALHAVAGLMVLLNAWIRLMRSKLDASVLAAAQVFWYFVVGLWPVLYGIVYL
jgi:cytochrome c oxidase subunit III